MRTARLSGSPAPLPRWSNSSSPAAFLRMTLGRGRCRSSSTIEPHLGFTGAAPRIQGREIEKGIADRALHLVSAVAHKKDLGHVRAEPLYLLPTMGGRIREKIQDLLLILAAHGVTRIVSAKLTPS